jgi:hypothetical protein
MYQKIVFSSVAVAATLMLVVTGLSALVYIKTKKNKF